MACNGTNNGDSASVDLDIENRQSISATPMDLLTNPNIRKKFFILAFDWVANAVVYNGLSYNTTNLGVSDYLAFFIGKHRRHLRTNVYNNFRKGIDTFPIYDPITIREYLVLECIVDYQTIGESHLPPNIYCSLYSSYNGIYFK